MLETGSFSAAARRHPLTPSAVARRIDALERAMGSSLFSRTTHAVRVTPAGLAFAERARRILAELHLARAEAVSLSSAPEGLIRIDAPSPLGVATWLQRLPSSCAPTLAWTCNCV